MPPKRSFLVTAGGTSERIDAVRCITNCATGKLGSLIAGRFAEEPETESVVYICGQSAVRPGHPKAEIVPVTGTRELEEAVRGVLASRKIDAVVHSMAVSDYRVHTVTTPRRWKNADGGLDREKKLPSGEEELLLVLRPTIKIISLFRELAPEALLVGFKLLDNVPHDELIAASRALLAKNRCAWVFANDTREMSGGGHTGYLVDAAGNEEKFEGKEAIARAITGRVLERLRRRKP